MKKFDDIAVIFIDKLSEKKDKDKGKMIQKCEENSVERSVLEVLQQLPNEKKWSE